MILAPIISPIELIKVQLQLDQVLHSPPPAQTTPVSAAATINSIANTAAKYPLRESAPTAANAVSFQSAARKADLMFGIFNLDGSASSHAIADGTLTSNRYTGVFDCFTTTLTRGMSMCILRLVPGWGVYVLTYESWNRYFDAKNTLGNNKPLSSFSGSLRVILGGSLAGMIAWTTSYPFDYIKTKCKHTQLKNGIYFIHKRATHPLSNVVFNPIYGAAGFLPGIPSVLSTSKLRVWGLLCLNMFILITQFLTLAISFTDGVLLFAWVVWVLHAVIHSTQQYNTTTPNTTTYR